ncbi:Flavin-dependent oxidoreductase, luciferase family (includes alkanesulfonate monooxygenase SsuD and methylene tetrahydromethanopterin reductase) [Actinacidiphila yanglinensis]|uniref:Flavin-dependent oxidoreductase, luciferase family (Includes alkanesulfonate monooxygenase SsuD and methylene tetrahydromethanopterin reductase) n=1 Tax=Actinacidiphila yanglinensis TaxID=310779 RepID=A0A1H6DSA4_9ACTN|nr:LLM class flavin-dependent oxidoreductase [Actinacidiphila yanglinensis]SEG87485.1 Flavin-dependent oxidoreductase, luciferase family (includes alkanesulfonate monooxygenase SsuD and methylene tetrahydromethanopterin reductase) [Actinacidiphila yanglinensis]
MPQHTTLFGFAPGTETARAAEIVRLGVQADRSGLDLFSTSDHPYYGHRLDAYSTLGFVLGATSGIAGLANVTNLPSRPAPVLARTLTSLSALSGGRIVLGIGAGGLWDEIERFGRPRLGPAQAVRALEEAITLVRALSGGGEPVTLIGEFNEVRAIEPADVPTPLIWTGSLGDRSLAVTGRLADGWIPGHASDWVSERYLSSRPLIDRAAEEAGRDPSAVATVFNLPGRITGRPLDRVRDDDGRWIGGSVRQWVDELSSAVLEHGAAGFVHFATGGDPLDAALGRWAEEVVPAVRENVAKG